MLMQLVTDTQTLDWGTIIVQSLITLGVVFGGAGFWEFLKTKFQAKREDKKAEDTSNEQITKMANQVTEMYTQMPMLTSDMRELKDDLSLLQKANEETIKYREARDQRDKEAEVVQQAVIESITGLMRDRLLDNYRRCIKKGYYSMEEREIYGAMFDCYEKPPFSGDGVMHDLRPIMKKLPMNPGDAGKLNDEDSID